MRVFVVTPPAPVIALERAKQHLRVDHDDEDALIEAQIAAATAHIDGPEGWLGRALGEQVLEARCARLERRTTLPCPPIVEIVSVKYIDADGVEQTLSSLSYRLSGRVLEIVDGASVPSRASDLEAARIRYKAGADSINPAIEAAILLMVGDLFAYRETAGSRVNMDKVQMSTTVEHLLSPLRVWL